jgi:hypothetical protein
MPPAISGLPAPSLLGGERVKDLLEGVYGHTWTSRLSLLKMPSEKRKILVVLGLGESGVNRSL